MTTANGMDSLEQIPALGALENIEQELQNQAEQIASAADQADGSAAEREIMRQASEAAARAAATMGVNMIRTLITMQAPYLIIQDDATGAVVDKLAPVLLKHGVGADLPPWMAAWREEIELGMVVAGIGFGVFVQVQNHKAQEAIRAEEERQARIREQAQRNGNQGNQGAWVDLANQAAA